MTVATSTIIDNRDGNTLCAALERMGAGGQELWIASAFFSLDALLLLADTLDHYARVRILFGDEANPRQRKLLLERLRTVSDADLLTQREKQPFLTNLQKMAALFASGRVEARCYTAKKFHAKAYIIKREMFPEQIAVMGSGNFTRQGLLNNIELNALQTTEQTEQLRVWYEERWEEAKADVVTEDVLAEIRRQIELYDPYYLYLKALYAWGQDRQGEPSTGKLPLDDILDEHQRQGYWQALKILKRQHGVMICDGVGLGKSFVALALMEHFCRAGQRVLLIAPKNILDNSWREYIETYLKAYRQPFGSIDEKAMTEFGFDLEKLEGLLECDSGLSEKECEYLRLLQAYTARADVVVIDESHNFRTPSANRYKYLYRVMQPQDGRRKQVIMLTATPINTHYADMSAQLGLITHEHGTLAGYGFQQIRKAAVELDRDNPKVDPAGQLSLALNETPNETLNRVLEQVVIQRSRTTCKALSAAAGKELRFPIRRDPECIEFVIGPKSDGYTTLIDLADDRFRPAVRRLMQVKKETDDKKLAKLLAKPLHGIKLAAFITEQYRRVPQPGSKLYTDEVRLAGLVYANTLKQLESSPAAFQGIIQSLATGLLARLQVVFGETVGVILTEHQGWIRTPIFRSLDENEGTSEDPDIIDDGDALDISGDEMDAWLQHAVQSRGLEKKLREFTPGEFDEQRWLHDIEGDLAYLREIHAAILTARQQPDPKLERFIPVLTRQLAEGKRVLLFTQSRRTAEYLEIELTARLRDYHIARIDSRVEDTRASIIHAFCPGYNTRPSKWARSVPERIDVLISTDVLSEGVNLQEAGAVVNYDIHWNPVRLIQRIGRVDRRLDPAITPREHVFGIFNVLPPPEIEKIISLVETVEERTLKISRALGIDEAFFKANDPAGTLKEFNRLYEGDMTGADVAATKYTEHFTEPDARTQKILDDLPPGAFGVWGKAPEDGLFALFEMEATPAATDTDRERYAQIIGRPVLVMERSGAVITHDAGAILKMLSGVQVGDHSASPTDEAALTDRLRTLKNNVRSAFADISLPRTIMPRLVCWMELRKA